jgi:hypothetical protein
MKKRPFIFIGSSAEGLDAAKALQANLDYVAESQIWHQGLFGLSEGTLESLVQALPRFDFAILTLTPDDLSTSRGNEQKAPRDNVLFELGLFIGALGRERVFIVVDRTANLKLPSDLAGITPAAYQPPISGNLQSALGAACTAIEQKVKRLGVRHGQGVDAHWWTGCLNDGETENPDFMMTIVNRTDRDLPWLNVHIFPSNTFRLEPLEQPTERLMSGQYAMYKFRMLEQDGRLTKWAQHFSEKEKADISVRVFKKNSADEPVLIDFELGAELHERIQKYRKLKFT